MIERDKRGGLRHAVSLHKNETQSIPKLFERRGERAAT